MESQPPVRLSASTGDVVTISSMKWGPYGAISGIKYEHPEKSEQFRKGAGVMVGLIGLLTGVITMPLLARGYSKGTIESALAEGFAAAFRDLFLENWPQWRQVPWVPVILALAGDTSLSRP
jgi:hypothetical protein